MEQLSKYQTISQPAYAEYKEKGSRFMAHAIPVNTKNEIKSHLERLWQENPSACHVCYAYRLGADGEDYRANDDGEPSGSAGKPIHGQLLSFDVTNCLTAVVRIYGGTKLGVGGLISAYKTAAKMALEQAQIVKKKVRRSLEVTFEYEQTNLIDTAIRQFEIDVIKQDFAIKCTFGIAIPLEYFEEAKAYFEENQISFTN